MAELYEKEAWQALLVDTVSLLDRELNGEKGRRYGITPAQSRSYIGSARQQAAHLLEVARQAQVAADRLDQLTKEEVRHDPQ